LILFVNKIEWCRQTLEPFYPTVCHYSNSIVMIHSSRVEGEAIPMSAKGH
jgi:hypothetical protein